MPPSRIDQRSFYQVANPLHSLVISVKHFAQQSAVIFGQWFTRFQMSSFNSPHSSQRTRTRSSIGRERHCSSWFISAARELICDADGDDARGQPPQFCRRRLISAQLG
jgi:hypothetical protein